MRRTNISCGLILLALGAAAIAQSPDLVEKRSAAAGYAGTMKFAIGRAARDCRDTLGKDDTYMRAIVDDWVARNGRYSGAAERWISMEVSEVANRDGLTKGLQLRDYILGQASRNGSDVAATIIGVTEEEKKTKCSTYADNVHSGKYDITASAPEYGDLTELVNYLAQ